MAEQALTDMIDNLIKGDQYSATQDEKECYLMSILKPLITAVAQGCPQYGRFIARLGDAPEEWRGIADIPPLPVGVFKSMDLHAVPKENIVRVLQSSSTTGQSPSRIYVDKTTAFRQARALAAVLKEHIGKSRRPFLVIDEESSLGHGGEITARGAAIRGIANFASETVFALRKIEDGDIEPDYRLIEEFLSVNRDQPVLVFGFTYIVWSRFIQKAWEQGIKYESPQAILLHSGGWKKLVSEAVSKEVFSEKASAIIGCSRSSILDFYGMVEQVGTVFVDCSEGNKHAPAFADVLIRRPDTFEEVTFGEEGIIEVVSSLPTSYPGQVLLTEDKGVLMGRDDCPCGRKGDYFRFTSRIERAEIRGCGDTFAEAQILT